MAGHREWSDTNFLRISEYIDSHMTNVYTVLDTYCYLYGALEKRQMNMYNALVTNCGTYTAAQKKTSREQLLHILFATALCKGHAVALCVRDVENPKYTHQPITPWETMNFTRMQTWVDDNIRLGHEVFEAYCFFRGIRSQFNLNVIDMIVTDFGSHTVLQNEISRVQLRQLLMMKIKRLGY